MKSSKVLLILFITLLLTCCSKEEKKAIEVKKKNEIPVYNNGSKPSNPNFKIEIVELIEIENTENLAIIDKPLDVTEDKDRNIYVLSAGNGKIIKYNKIGKYVCDFAGSGNDPGELKWGNSIACIDDTIFVPDFYSKNINKYDLNGKFIKSINSPIISQSLSITGSNEVFVSENNEIIEIEETQILKPKLILLDVNFKTIANIGNLGEIEIKSPGDYYLKNRIFYAMGKEYIYVAENSVDLCRINMYDYSGEKKGIINKTYAKVTYDFERENNLYTFNSIYKRSINNLFVDYQDNLWVVKAVKDSIKNNENQFMAFQFDVFSKGVYINKINLTAQNVNYCTYNFNIITKVVGDRIYSLHVNDNIVEIRKYVISDNKKND